MIDYKYSEDRLVADLKAYIDTTYKEHYSQSKFQTTEFIIDNGHGIGFTAGNIIKYCQRYGKKDGRNRKDVLKILHYALIMLHVHDLEMAQSETLESRIKKAFDPNLTKDIS
tara:strand:+ start:394 stop:729 length:336 start_codon:yes stop_codon:yes gene_type:complete